MTDRAQFEAMLEALINEDQEAAHEIFHNIVVAKSREIYEELLAEDFGAEEEEEGEEEEESGDSNPFGGSEEGEEEEGEEEEEEEGGEDDFGSEEPEGDIEDRVMDLEDALEELKADFDALMADEANEPEHNDGETDPAFGGEDDMDFGSEDDMGGEEDAFAMGDEEDDVKEVVIHHKFDGQANEMDEFEQFMEYVNKVALPKHGDNGANTKSIVASKNDMGGTTANILNGGTSTSGGTQGGLLKPSTQEENFGNVNVPGGNAGKTGFKKSEPGHGAEKKGKGEAAPNPKSIIGSRK